jgi:hypothetical protein
VECGVTTRSARESGARGGAFGRPGINDPTGRLLNVVRAMSSPRLPSSSESRRISVSSISKGWPLIGRLLDSPGSDLRQIPCKELRHLRFKITPAPQGQG